MIKIFISYSREDEAFAKKLFNSFKESKMEPWLDEQKIITGDHWKDVIDKEINTANCFLPILSEASINNNRYFQTELDIAIQVSESRDNNFIMPVRIEDCNPGLSKVKKYQILDLFPSYEHQYQKLVKHIKEKHRALDFKKLMNITWKTVDFISRFAVISHVATQYMSDDIQPPKYNMAFAKHHFPNEGGKVELFGTDVTDQLLTMRYYARENNFRYTAFFIDQEGHVIGHTANNKKLKLKAIQLDLPINTATVFIGLGYGDDLDDAKDNFGKESIAHEQLLWVVYGDNETVPTKKKDHLKIFKSIIFEADKEVNAEKRQRHLENNRETIIHAFEALYQSKDWGNIGMMLTIMMTETKDSPVALFSKRQSHDLCDVLDQKKEQIAKCFIEFNYLRAQELSNNALKEQYGIKYTERHRFIESAIRLIWDQCDKDDNWLHDEIIAKQTVYQFIAKCYLYRSKLALTKGKSIPEKKLEALLKAKTWSEKDCKETNDLKVYILLEQATWDKHFSQKDLEEGLKNYICEYKQNSLDLSNRLHLAVIDKLITRLIEKKKQSGNKFSDKDQELLTQLNNYDEQILSLPATHKLNSFFEDDPGCFLRDAEDLSFYQVRSAYRLDRADDISKYLDTAISKLSKFLQTHNIWDKTISLLKQVSDKNIFNGKWEKSAIKAWKKCIEAENLIKLSIHLRWYWSNYQELYDLAFQAALNTEQYTLAARIADTAKSRPTIKIQNAEQALKEDNSFKQYIEADILSFTEAYMARLDTLKKISRIEKELPHKKIEDVPEGWSAIHFYIQKNSNDVAYASIISSKDQTSIHTKLDISKLWKTFNTWQADSRAFSVLPANTLKQMCIEAGEMLKPVLDQLPSSSNIIFIPHGFLHLIPLHASIIDQKDTYLFSEKLCVYLPSWSIISGQNETILRNNDYLFSHWEKEEHLEQLEELKQLKWDNEKRSENAPGEVINYLEKHHPLSTQPPQAPNLITIFSHGKGDYMNPYQSKFALHNGSLTHQAIITGKFLLNGTRVILTACETDLVAGQFGLVDEHLSLANAFLTKNSSEVLGAFFKCKFECAKDIVTHIKNNPQQTLYEALQEIQKKWITEKKPITDIAVFRVMGLPKTGGNKNA